MGVHASQLSTRERRDQIFGSWKFWLGFTAHEGWGPGIADIELGRWLHAYQDSYSHEGYSPIIGGHWFDWTWPDETWLDYAKADQMAYGTYLSLVNSIKWDKKYRPCFR
jgi:hypothetical protein